MYVSSGNSFMFLKKKQGFTIVELLIVVVVIAILAAITIVAYNGISKRAKDSAIQSTLSQGVKKLELAKVNESGGLYPASMAAAGLDSFVNNGDTIYSYGVSADSKTFCLALSKAGRTYYITETVANPKTGICNGAVGVPGTGDVAVDGTSSSSSFTIFNTTAPGTGQTVYNDGGGSLKVGNRFYTTENSGIKVTGLRIYNPSNADSTFLSLGITAYAYTNDWTGATIQSPTTYSQSPLTTKVFSGTRIAGTWTDINFDTPITLPKVSNASGAADLLTLAVQFAGGNHYVFITGTDQYNNIQSTSRPGTYLSESPYVGRGAISVSSTAVEAFYGIDIIYTPVTP